MLFPPALNPSLQRVRRLKVTHFPHSEKKSRRVKSFPNGLLNILDLTVYKASIFEN